MQHIRLPVVIQLAQRLEHLLIERSVRIAHYESRLWMLSSASS
jgi:hypothetical protein